ncbi:hypothetical protein AAVH_17428 [Aphelenchoides avenae]|nr:hypothetical protein AAVH_17428 [Aphelenchus avenae]
MLSSFCAITTSAVLSWPINDSAVATQCADAIRLFDFTDLSFFLRDSRIIVYRLTPNGCFGPLICQLELGSENELAEFVSEAFRNCSVGRFAWIGHSQHVLQAIREVAKSVSVDSLVVMVDHFEDFRELEGYVDDFRRVKELEVSQSTRLTPDEKTNLQRFCQRKNVSKLYCLP